MGWLGGKNKDHTEQFDSNISPEAKADWVRQVSQRNLLIQWGEALLRVEELFTETVLYYPEKQKEVLKTLNKLKAEWLKTDRKLVTVAEAVVLYDVLHKELPALIYRLGLLKATRGSSNKNHEDDYLDLWRKLEQLLSAVFTVRAKVDAQKLARFQNLSPSSSTTQLTGLSWPVYSDTPEDVAIRLADLGELWSAQREKVHTVEDEYLLERIVTDYIPSSFQLYAPFISGRVEMESIARAALLSQLELIQDHLENVAETSFREQMKTVNAQTEFLKDRLKDN
jgi:hypothetical protein